VVVTCLNPLAHPPDARRILVIRLGALGDVVRTLPALDLLRRHYPNAHIAWLVERKAEGALRGNPKLDEVLVFPREELSHQLRDLRGLAFVKQVRSLVAELRKARFDLVMDFHSILKSGVLARLTGASMRVSYARPHARERSELFATHRASLAPGRVSRFERNAALVDYLGVGITSPRVESSSPIRLGRFLQGPAKEADLAPLRGALAGLDAPAILHPGTSSSAPYKRYTVPGYAAVARQLEAQLGLRSLVTSGPVRGELEFAQAVVDASGGAAMLAPDTPTLDALAWLFAQARVFIGSDSGPLHIASLVGTPVIQLLGPTDAVENAPYPGTPSRTVREPMPCSPCRRGCAAAICMRSIEPAAVVSAALDLLGKSALPSPTKIPRPRLARH
jgi:3-deoxy-D-manno-octulosonic-acid transferase/heptosyltransferase-1